MTGGPGRPAPVHAGEVLTPAQRDSPARDRRPRGVIERQFVPHPPPSELQQ
ncbi:MAG TPA: hypothetical protein VFS20_08895 [Longimicrobium sp.]|nr:hypothetical protein [Longimicrobium sp.]